MTILIKGPNKHTLMQTKDALRDRLRTVKNALEDGFVVTGAGAYEVATHAALKKFMEEVKGRARLGIQVKKHRNKKGHHRVPFFKGTS